MSVKNPPKANSAYHISVMIKFRKGEEKQSRDLKLSLFIITLNKCMQLIFRMATKISAVLEEIAGGAIKSHR